MVEYHVEQQISVKNNQKSELTTEMDVLENVTCCTETEINVLVLRECQKVDEEHHISAHIRTQIEQFCHNITVLS